MGKTAVDAKRAGTIFTLPPEDKSFVLVNDKDSPLYDERLDLPVNEEMALSLAREGQIKPGMVRKNGPKLEILDGRQRYRAELLANEWIQAGDERVAFRGGQLLQFKFEVVRPEDEKAAIRKMIAANLHIEDTPMVRARRIARALKWGLTEEDVRINYGFKDRKTISKILDLLDLCPKAQAAVDKGLPESVARRMVGLSHEKQEELLVEMEKKGVMHGAAAIRAITEKKQGKEVTGTKTGNKMLSREFVENYLAELADVKPVGVSAVRANLQLILGVKDALVADEFAPYREAVKRARQ
jgi:ParB family chromosome partitioning protein